MFSRSVNASSVRCSRERAIAYTPGHPLRGRSLRSTHECQLENLRSIMLVKFIISLTRAFSVMVYPGRSSGDSPQHGMAKAYSNDLRRKILERYERGSASLSELA